MPGYNMKIGVDFTNFPGWILNFPHAIKGAVILEASSILAASQDLVPVKTGNLKLTGGLVEQELPNGGISITIGYGGNTPSKGKVKGVPVTYAYIVHENPKAHHKGITQWKYLETPFARAEKTMPNRLIRAVRGALKEQGITGSNYRASLGGAP